MAAMQMQPYRRAKEIVEAFSGLGFGF